METTTHVMSLLNYVKTFVAHYASSLGMDPAEEAKELIVADKNSQVKSFQKFAESFCDKKNIMNKGVYEFVSCDGEIFTYTVTK